MRKLTPKEFFTMIRVGVMNGIQKMVEHINDEIKKIDERIKK